MSGAADGTTPAPAGQVWVCGACGKTSPTKYGFDAEGRHVAVRDWDESCMLNAVLCHAEQQPRGDGLTWIPVEAA